MWPITWPVTWSGLSRDRNLVFIYDQWKSISFKCVKYQSVFLVLSNVKININANPPLLLSSPINRTFTGQLNFFSKHMSFSRTIHRTFIYSPDGYTVKFHQLPTVEANCIGGILEHMDRKIKCQRKLQIKFWHSIDNLTFFRQIYFHRWLIHWLMSKYDTDFWHQMTPHDPRDPTNNWN